MKKIFIFCAIFVGVIAIRLSRPELTETQLLLEYWWVWIVIVTLSVMTFLTNYKEQ